MSLACSTCHIHIRQGAESLAPPSDVEDDQLDWAWGVDAQSRLSCNVKMGDCDLTIELPRHTRNLVREA
jgi:2Fe-2S ferredoxin